MKAEQSRAVTFLTADMRLLQHLIDFQCLSWTMTSTYTTTSEYGQNGINVIKVMHVRYNLQKQVNRKKKVETFFFLFTCAENGLICE